MSINQNIKPQARKMKTKVERRKTEENLFYGCRGNPGIFCIIHIICAEGIADGENIKYGKTL